MRIENSRIAVRRVETPVLSRNSSAPNVVAQPINMYVPTDLSLNSDVQSARQNARIGGLLRELAGNTVRIAGAKYQENVKEDTLRGMQDANERLEMDSSRVSGFLHSEEAYKRGYRATEDEARAIDLKTQYLEQLKQNNYFLDDPNPRAKTDMLFKDMYKNVFNDEYMNSNERKGVMSESGILMAKQALLEGEEAYNKAYAEDRRIKLLNATGEVINYSLDSLLKKGMMTPAALQETVNAISAQTLESEGSSNLRPTELGTFAVSKIGDAALAYISEGNFKEADAILYSLRGLRGADGNLLYDTVVGSNPKTGAISMPYKDMMDNLEAQSIKAKEEYRKEQEALLKKAQEKNAANMWMQAYTYDTLDEASKVKYAKSLPYMVAQAVQSGAINGEDGARLMKFGVSLSQNAGFAETTNTEAYTRLLRKNQTGNLSFDDVEANKAYLTKTDYTSLVKSIGDTETSLKSIGLGNNTAEWKALMSGKEALNDRIGKTTLDKLNQNMRGDATKALQLVDREVTKFIYKAQQEGRKVSIPEINDFLDDLTDRVIDDNTGLIRPEYIGREITKKDKANGGKTQSIRSGRFDNTKSTDQRGSGDDLDESFFTR